MTELNCAGAALRTLTAFGDTRGAVLEHFQLASFAEIDPDFTVAQSNLSLNNRGTLRGIHFPARGHRQGKYVIVLRGAIIDWVLDLRAGSPTEGATDRVELNAIDLESVQATEPARALYVPPGCGHAFLALEPNTTVLYLLGAPYSPGQELAVTPFDPELGLDLPDGLVPIVSDKDRAAPTWAQLQGQRPSELPVWKN